MKGRKSLFFLLVLLSSVTASAQTAFDYQKDFRQLQMFSQDSNSNFYYWKLLPRFQANDTSLSKYEMLALLIGFTTQADYKPFEDLDSEKVIYEMNESEDYEGALYKSHEYLSTHPLSLKVLKEKSFALSQLKQKDSAEYFMDLSDRIMSAMIFSGNGKKPETAIFSLALDDGENFTLNIGRTIGNKTTGKSPAGNMMEIIDAVDERGNHTNLFFVIQHAFNKQEAAAKAIDDFKKSKKDKKEKDKDKKEKPKKEKKTKDKKVAAENAETKEPETLKQ